MLNNLNILQFLSEWKYIGLDALILLFIGYKTISYINIGISTFIVIVAKLIFAAGIGALIFSPIILAILSFVFKEIDNYLVIGILILTIFISVSFINWPGPRKDLYLIDHLFGYCCGLIEAISQIIFVAAIITFILKSKIFNINLNSFARENLVWISNIAEELNDIRTVERERLEPRVFFQILRAGNFIASYALKDGRSNEMNELFSSTINLQKMLANHIKLAIESLVQNKNTI